MRVVFAPEVEDLHKFKSAFFFVIGDTYFIKYITNNHVSGQYIF